MELTQIAYKIEDLNNEIEERKKKLENFVKSKKIGKTFTALNKKIEIETIKAKYEDERPITLVKEIVKGKCADEYGEWEQVQIEFRAAVKLIEATEAQLTGYQSINKYMSET